MKFLLDQDVYAATHLFLRDLGHDAVPAAAIGSARATDPELLRIAGEQGRILVTRDRDFGWLVFAGNRGAGIIYLRTLPTTLAAVHRELEVVLRSRSESELRGAFVVVEPGRHRFRNLSA
jgi:predicted nuclease of predicted toxin-antitoxin system